jgi:alpha-1,2-mannosyltransferase
LFTRPEFQLAVVATVGAVLAVFRVLQLAALARDRMWAADFGFYWTAAIHVLHGESMYSAQQLAGPYIAENQLGFLYPPPFAAVLSPFAAMLPPDGGLAGVLWMLLGAALVAVSTAAIVRAERLGDRLTPALRTYAVVLFVVAALVFPPLIAELSVGNVHIEILALLSLGWLGLRRGDRRGDILGGAAIGVAALLKVFPGLLIAWLLLTRRWRAAAGSVLAAAVLAVATLPLTGTQPWLDYPTVLANMGPILDIHDSVSATMWLAPAVGFSLARLVVTAFGVGLLVLASRLRPASVSFALVAAVSVLIAPTVFHHYLAVLVLPLLLAIAGGVSWRWIAASYLLMWGGQQAALGDYSWVLSRIPQTLGWALLLVALVRQGLATTDVRARKRASTPAVEPT